MCVASVARMMKNILVVGEPVLGDELKKTVFSRTPAQLFHAGTTDEALALHRQHGAHLILIAQHAMDAQAAGFCRALRADPGTRRVSVLLVTDGSSPDEVEQALETGANGVVHRPVTVMLLLKILSRFLDVAPRRDVQLPAELHTWHRHERTICSCMTVNVSRTGLLVDVQEPLTLGATVLCRVTLPEGAPVMLAGQVVRKAEQNRLGARRYGIRFIRPSKEDSERLESLVLETRPEVAV